MLAPILTAICVEATLGTTESFHPLISSVRPQGCQVEVAPTIIVFLKGSKVASIRNSSVLLSRRPNHDSYALSTSSKWLGPVLGDLGLARSQIEIELNSTTDDLLIDVANNKIHHGGNSQAFSIISSTEKTRLSLGKIGGLLFV